MPKPTGVGLAERIAEATCEQMGYTLKDVELVKEATGRFLRFYIDKPGGVTLEDCEAFHRRVIPSVEHIDYDYMEVSSPGVDRPLKRQRDFDEAAGQAVEVRLYKPLNGVKLFTGALVGLKDGIVTIEGAQGEQLSFKRELVALVKKVFEFDERMLDALDEEEQGT
ncbi:ribosome maturation factor RimP [Bacillota bacterium Meth-B3]|nr:ribosome maturation factor RimP [Christensenellaceae bacterium]MEA5066610.1 ribosome maturation factor RimP [Eubacteriales bacterium]